MAITFDVNNGRRIVVAQEKHDGGVTVKHMNADGSVDTSLAYAPYVIRNGDFVMLMNLFRHIMDEDIQNDFINPYGKNAEISRYAKQKIVYDALDQYGGYAIRRVIDNGRPMYVRRVYNGNYEFTQDHTYAKHFTESTALKHILTLAGRDRAEMADNMTVTVERRNA